MPVKLAVSEFSSGVFASDAIDGKPYAVRLHLSNTTLNIATLQGSITVCEFPMHLVSSGAIEITKLNANAVMLRDRPAKVYRHQKNSKSGGETFLAFRSTSDCAKFFDLVSNLSGDRATVSTASSNETPPLRQVQPSQPMSSPQSIPSSIRPQQSSSIYRTEAPLQFTPTFTVPYANDSPVAQHLSADHIAPVKMETVDNMPMDHFEHELVMEQLFVERDRRREAFLNRMEMVDNDSAIRNELHMVHREAAGKRRLAKAEQDHSEHAQLRQVWLSRRADAGMVNLDHRGLSATEMEDAENRFAEWKALRHEHDHVWAGVYGDIAAEEERKRQQTLQKLKMSLFSPSGGNGNKEHQQTRAHQQHHHHRHSDAEHRDATTGSYTPTNTSRSTSDVDGGSSRSTLSNAPRNASSLRGDLMGELRQLIYQFDEEHSPKSADGTGRENILGQVRMLMMEHEEEAARVRELEEAQRQREEAKRIQESLERQTQAAAAEKAFAESLRQSQTHLVNTPEQEQLRLALEAEAKLIASVRYAAVVPKVKAAVAFYESPQHATSVSAEDGGTSPLVRLAKEIMEVPPVRPQMTLSAVSSPTTTVEAPATQAVLSKKLVLESPATPSSAAAQKLQPSASSAPPATVGEKASDWKATVDQATGKTYYVNKELKKTTWKIEETDLGVAAVVPPRAATPVTAAPPVAVQSPTDASALQPGPNWKATVDQATGKTYYVNKDLKKTTWKIEETLEEKVILPATGSAPTQRKETVEAPAIVVPQTPATTLQSPTGWLAKQSPDGKTYYVNKDLKKTTWKIEETDLGTQAVEKVAVAAPKPSTPVAPTISSWKATVDQATGKTYYVNKELKKTTWKIEETDLGTPSGAPASPTVKLPDGWKEAKHPQTGRTYYVHAASKKTSWEIPTA